MSTSSPQSIIPKVRTYAADLDFARTKTTPTPNRSVSKIVPANEPLVVDTGAEGVVPPFHSFTNTTKTTLTPIKTNITPTPVSSSQSETQKIITKSSNLSVGNPIKESLPAVIITDTKHKRFKLSEAITASLQSWWTAKKAVAKKNKIPRYTVPEAERRKGVIQKATSKTGRTSSADHNAVISRIKATKQVPHEVALVTQPNPVQKSDPEGWETTTPGAITEKSVSFESPVILPPIPDLHSTIQIVDNNPTPVGVWESNIQSKVNALTAPATLSPLITSGKEFTKIKEERTRTSPPVEVGAQTPLRVITPNVPILSVDPIPVTHPVVQTIPVTPRPSELSEQSHVSIETPNNTTPTSTPRITPIIPQAVFQEQKPKPVTNIQLATNPEPDPHEHNVPERPQRRFAPPREEQRSILSTLLKTNTVVFIAFGVLIFVVVSGVGIRSYLEKADPTTPSVGIANNAVFPDTTFPAETYFVSAPADLTNAIVAQKSAPDSLIEINFLNNSGNVLEPTELVQILDANILFDFKSTLTEVAIGTYRESSWVVFMVRDKNTALGGMLDWENYLYRDLAPILTTSTGLSRNRFEDAIINTIDVRILKNTDGSEAVVYGFTNYNTLLITTNTTAFLNLAGTIR